jgi:hypothetical protein
MCLIAWNEPIGAAEGEALLGVGDRHVQRALRAAELLERVQHRGTIVQRLQLRSQPSPG